MKRPMKETSPRLQARITGLFYLLTMLTGIYAQFFVSNSLIVDGDAAATARNILEHRGLLQAGFAVYMIEMACNVVIAALFYRLLRPAGRTLSLVAAFLGLTGSIVKIVGRLFFLGPLLVLGGALYLQVFNTAQLQALSLLLLDLNDHAAAMALIFLGLYAFAR